MIIYHITLKLPAEDRPEILKSLLALQKATWANDAGVVAYHFSIDLEDSGLIHLYEEWQSMEDIKAHARKPHMSPFQKLRQDQGIEVVKFSRFTAEKIDRLE